jgi:hypothetical protein
MIFGTVVSHNLHFCSIECSRHSGFEPTRMHLPGETINKMCYGCGIELDTGDFPPECCQSCGAPFDDANASDTGNCAMCDA